MTGATMLTSVAVFRGELNKMLLALGVVILIMLLIWAIEEFRLRAISGLGIVALGLAGLCAAVLIVVGLLPHRGCLAEIAGPWSIRRLTRKLGIVVELARNAKFICSGLKLDRFVRIVVAEVL